MAADRNGFQCNQVFPERQSSPDDLSPGAGTSGGAGRLAVTAFANLQFPWLKKFFDLIAIFFIAWACKGYQRLYFKWLPKQKRHKASSRSGWRGGLVDGFARV